MADKTFAPIYLTPGTNATLSDSQNNSITVIAIQNPEVLEFVSAFQEWVALAEMPMNVSEQTMQYARRKLNRAFNKLPATLWQELEKQKADIILPERGI